MYQMIYNTDVPGRNVTVQEYWIALGRRYDGNLITWCHFFFRQIQTEMFCTNNKNGIWHLVLSLNTYAAYDKHLP